MRSSRIQKRSDAGLRTGTLTIMLLVTAIVLAVIAVLTLQTARTGAAHTEAFASNVEQFYKNDTAAQELLATIDERLQVDGVTIGDMREVVPTGEITANGIKVAFIDGAAVNPADVHLTTETYDSGISASGISQADAPSVPALVVELSFDGRSSVIESWKHVRSYDDSASGSSSALYTGETSPEQNQ